MNAKTLGFNFAYIGNVNHTAKMQHGISINVDTFAVYLAPSTLSGVNVCAKATKECIMGCLNTSGRVKMDVHNTIVPARIRKTQAFYEQRENFMKLLVNEIRLAKGRAERKGNAFAVRLNGTSDLSPELFKHEGKSLMEIFSDTQFYDYTKILNRSKMLSKYANYDLTFSYTGYNWSECETALNNNVRVAVIFNVKAGQPLPESFNGYKVIDGDLSDYRPIDSKDVIVGLRWKNIANRANNEAIKNSPFVVKPNGEKHVNRKDNVQNQIAA